MEIGPKWVHMARYGLILRLDGALWLPIIFKPLRTKKGAIKDAKKSKKSLKVRAKPAKDPTPKLPIQRQSLPSRPMRVMPVLCQETQEFCYLGRPRLRLRLRG